MARAPKPKISIPHVAWRAGRPRFSPGPRVRKLGFAGEDLRHGAAGAWFTVEEALAWSASRHAEIEKRRADRRAGKRPRPVAGVRLYSVEDLFEDWFKTPRLRGEAVTEGKRTQKALAPATIADYRKKRDVLKEAHGELYVSPVAALTAPILFGVYEELWQDRGLATARGVVAVLSSALSWGIRRGKVKLATNPALRLGMEMPEPRLRALTPKQVAHLVAAADALGRPEIGDAVLLGVWTGQRQVDRLQLVDLGLVEGRRLFRQSKTRAIVEIPEAPQLAARLAAARRRRADWPVQPTHILIDEATRQPWNATTFRHEFAKVRQAAVDGAGELPAMPDLVDPETGPVRDQDLRDTAVTWLARAGCTVPQICSITGHSEASATQVLKHYLSHHREMADAAIAKVVSWYEGQERAG